MDLKQARLQAGLTLKEVADKVDLNWSAIGHYENGRRDIPPALIDRLADIYDVKVEELEIPNRRKW